MINKIIAPFICLAFLSACGGNSNNELVNLSPIVNAGIDLTVNEQTLVILSGTASDRDGDIISYQWEQNSGDTVVINDRSLALTTFTSPTTTTTDQLSFTLTVTDDSGETATDTVIVYVNPVNNPPTINLDEDIHSISGKQIQLNAIISDSDGAIESINWSQTNGMNVVLENDTTLTPSFIADFIEAETITIQATVVDNEGATTTDSINVILNTRNELITENFDDQPNGSLSITTTQDIGCETSQWNFTEIANTIISDYQVDLSIINSGRSAEANHTISFRIGNSEHIHVELPELTNRILSLISVGEISMLLLDGEPYMQIDSSQQTPQTENTSFSIDYSATACGADNHHFAFFTLDSLSINKVGE